MKPIKRWFDELFTTDRRKSERRKSPQLVTFYWDGGPPTPRAVRDISATGFFVITEQRWYPGTLVMVRLQRPGWTGLERSITVRAKVVRTDGDGVGFEFVPPVRHGSQRILSLMEEGADQKELDRFTQRLNVAKTGTAGGTRTGTGRPGSGGAGSSGTGNSGTSGQAMIEYVLILPMILILILNVVNFGGFIYAWITVANAVRAGADYAIMGGASTVSPRPPTTAQIQALIQQDISSLPNAATTPLPSVTQGTDPESATDYVLTTITVTYTYTPLINAGGQIGGMGFYVTIPPTNITRSAVMRSIQ
jgi:Flp pilus assembly protein TadG